MQSLTWPRSVHNNADRPFHYSNGVPRVPRAGNQQNKYNNSIYEMRGERACARSIRQPLDYRDCWASNVDAGTFFSSITLCVVRINGYSNSNRCQSEMSERATFIQAKKKYSVSIQYVHFNSIEIYRVLKSMSNHSLFVRIDIQNTHTYIYTVPNMLRIVRRFRLSEQKKNNESHLIDTFNSSTQKKRSKNSESISVYILAFCSVSIFDWNCSRLFASGFHLELLNNAMQLLFTFR